MCCPALALSDREEVAGREHPGLSWLQSSTGASRQWKPVFARGDRAHGRLLRTLKEAEYARLRGGGAGSQGSALMPFGNNPTQPTPQPGPAPSFDPNQLAQQLGMGTSGMGSAGGIDTGIPEAFRQQVDLALRRKLGARYQELSPDEITQISSVLW